MANISPKTNTKQVSAQIPIELYELLEEHRWDVRKNMAEVVRTAVEEYAQSHGLLEQPKDAA